MTGEHLAKIESQAAGKTRIDVSQMAEGPDQEFDCDTGTCAFNHYGVCRYYAAHGDLPVMTEEDGCLSGVVED